jgi:3-oxoacyl-[acyl-carrier protein] reductase
MYAGKICVVTGASRGIGAVIADHFARNKGVVTRLSRSEYWQCDVSDPDNVRKAFRNVMEQYGRVDIVVNNAGLGPAGFAVGMDPTVMSECVSTNLIGTVNVCRDAARLMRQGGGRIINIGSIHTALEPAGAAIYAATKAAVETFSAAFAKEVAPWGVTVNTIGMASFETDMWRGLSDEKRAEFLALLPIPRMTTKDDITNVVDFFASPRSSFITAQTVYLGGIHR